MSTPTSPRIAELRKSDEIRDTPRPHVKPVDTKVGELFDDILSHDSGDWKTWPFKK